MLNNRRSLKSSLVVSFSGNGVIQEFFKFLMNGLNLP